MTDQAEAMAVVALGVDAIGFIFVRASPRFIEAEQVRAITANLPPFVHRVGVFMDATAAEMNETITFCGLTMAQLHGDEPPDLCRAVIRPVLKVFRVRADARPDFMPYRGVVQGFLLDTYRKGQAGGTGATFDWELVQGLALPGPLVLAGGLTPNNVGTAIRQARPFAVDVNSGVEASPGRKDLTLIKKLCEEVHKADTA